MDRTLSHIVSIVVVRTSGVNRFAKSDVNSSLSMLALRYGVEPAALPIVDAASVLPSSSIKPKVNVLESFLSWNGDQNKRIFLMEI